MTSPAWVGADDKYFISICPLLIPTSSNERNTHSWTRVWFNLFIVQSPLAEDSGPEAWMRSKKCGKQHGESTTCR